MARPDLQGARARVGDIARTNGRDGRRSRRTGLHPRRPGRRRPFRQDGPNGIEYGLMQAYADGFDILQGQASGTTCPPKSASISTSPTSPRSGGAAA